MEHNERERIDGRGGVDPRPTQPMGGVDPRPTQPTGAIDPRSIRSMGSDQSHPYPQPEGQHLTSDTGKQQFAILTQLLQAAAGMQHINELFLLLATKMVRNLRIEIVQIWTMEATSAYQAPAVLRATAFYDQSIPVHVIDNSHVTTVANDLLKRQQAILSQPVGNLFSAYQSRLLSRYGLAYCICCATMSNLPLPSVDSSAALQTSNSPSMVAALLFSAQPRPQHFAITVNQILEQTLLIAKNQGLLQVPVAREAITPSSEVLQPQALPPLHELIPVRMRARESMRSSNPFASAAAISDKRAQAFLSAIDGSKTVAEIAALKRMDGKDMVAALRLLLQQERIQLYTPEGQTVDGELYLKLK
jgi:hypothetical protein